jgi:hypothetical protein
VTLEKGAALGQLRLQGSAADEARAFMSSVHGACWPRAVSVTRRPSRHWRGWRSRG